MIGNYLESCFFAQTINIKVNRSYQCCDCRRKDQAIRAHVEPMSNRIQVKNDPGGKA